MKDYSGREIKRGRERERERERPNPRATQRKRKEERVRARGCCSPEKVLEWHGRVGSGMSARAGLA